MPNLFQTVIGTLALLTAPLSTTWAAPPAAGCGSDGWRSGHYTMNHGGVARTFRVHVPNGFNNDSPAPLILVFHGWGGNEDEFLGFKSVTSLADKRGYISLENHESSRRAPETRPGFELAKLRPTGDPLLQMPDPADP